MQFRRRRRDAMLWLASYRSRLRPLSRRELTCISESPRAMHRRSCNRPWVDMPLTACLARNGGPDRPRGDPIGRDLFSVRHPPPGDSRPDRPVQLPVCCLRSASAAQPTGSAGWRPDGQPDRWTRIAARTHACHRTCSGDPPRDVAAFAGHQQLPGRHFAGWGPFAIGPRQTDLGHVDVRSTTAVFGTAKSEKSDAVRRRQGSTP